MKWRLKRNQALEHNSPKSALKSSDNVAQSAVGGAGSSQSPKVGLASDVPSAKEAAHLQQAENNDLFASAPSGVWQWGADAKSGAHPSTRCFRVPRSYRIAADMFSVRPVVVQGELEGRDLVAGLVTVLPGGALRGRSRVGTLLVAGLVAAEVQASERVEVASQGEMQGVIQAPAISVAPGATLNGASLAIGE
jgi:cytoskeletal protein CcmA (bactofilin family)